MGDTQYFLFKTAVTEKNKEYYYAAIKHYIIDANIWEKLEETDCDDLIEAQTWCQEQIEWWKDYLSPKTWGRTADRNDFYPLRYVIWRVVEEKNLMEEKVFQYWNDDQP